MTTSVTARPGRAAWLPRGSTLPDSVWDSRHRWVLAILVVQAVALVPFALVRGFSFSHALMEAALPSVLVVLASLRRLPRVTRASLAGVGLMVESGIAVHLSGGVIEAHFHFFVMVPVVALYESWLPFGLAVGYVLFQHGIVGTLDSSAVYNHRGAQDHPWWWAGLHAGLFAAACLGALVNWSLHERARHVADQLTQATERDVLTGLPNRAHLRRLGEEAIRQGRRVSVLLIDLDGFKDVNDTLGHAGGDVLLAQVGERLRSVLADGEVVGRLGGDEFVVVLPGQGAAAAGAVADQVRRALAESFTVEGLRLDIGGSVGFSTWAPPTVAPGAVTPTATMTELLRQADVAMYVAKQSRCGTALYGVGQDRDARLRLTFIGELREAISHDQLIVHFQPKLCLATGVPSGVEALVRWQHPERGLLAPGHFIPIAEQTSLIDSLTETVLDKALRAVQSWHAAGVLVGVSVNVSPQSLTSSQLLHTVDRLLQAHAVDGRWLCLEITEDVFVGDDDGALLILRELKERGVTIAIDDFGSGYSSMSYLQRLPADELKIDRSLIAGLGVHRPMDSNAQPSPAGCGLVIVRSIIEMGHSLGLQVVAEGVETPEVLTMLDSAGVRPGPGLSDRPADAVRVGLGMARRTQHCPRELAADLRWSTDRSPGPSSTGTALCDASTGRI